MEICEKGRSAVEGIGLKGGEEGCVLEGAFSPSMACCAARMIGLARVRDASFRDWVSSVSRMWTNDQDNGIGCQERQVCFLQCGGVRNHICSGLVASMLGDR